MGFKYALTKQNETKMETAQFINSLGSSDLHSFTLCLQAYNDSASTRGEEIADIGFNTSSGYVYIALENGICIASCFGRPVEYITTNYNNGEETFHETYAEAEEALSY
jgi:hypothetical protein